VVRPPAQTTISGSGMVNSTVYGSIRANFQFVNINATVSEKNRIDMFEDLRNRRQSHGQKKPFPERFQVRPYDFH